MLSPFVRQLQYGVTLRAAAVSEVLDVADAVLLQDEPAFRGVPQLQKGFVLAAAFVFLLRQHTPQGINNHRCFKKIDNVRVREHIYNDKRKPQTEQSVIQLIYAVSSVHEAHQLLSKIFHSPNPFVFDLFYDYITSAEKNIALFFKYLYLFCL